MQTRLIVMETGKHLVQVMADDISLTLRFINAARSMRIRSRTLRSLR